MPESSLNINQKNPLGDQMSPRPKSQSFTSLSFKYLPGGVNSPVRSFKNYLPFPLVVRSSEKATLRDMDGRRYIDLINSWGAIIHGHAHPYVLEAMQKQMQGGWGYGALCEIEVQFAQMICEVTKQDLVRFVCSGTEATMTALRLARGFTGRDHILKFNGHYHGHHDQLLVQAGSGVLEMGSQDSDGAGLQLPSSSGIPKELVQFTHSIPFNDVDALENYFRRFGEKSAAVILEPVAGNMGTVPADRDYLYTLKQLCKAHGVVLIFDEVMTGFRLGANGARGLYNVDCDLTCYGKVIGGGLPVAAVAGKREIMEQLAPLGKVYQAGTLAGNPLCMAAGMATIELTQAEGFYERLETKARILERPIIDAIQKGDYPVSWSRVGTMMTLFFQKQKPHNLEAMQESDTQAFTAFFRFLFERGVLIPPSPFEAWFLSDGFLEEELDQAGHQVAQFLKSYY